VARYHSRADVLLIVRTIRRANSNAAKKIPRFAGTQTATSNFQPFGFWGHNALDTKGNQCEKTTSFSHGLAPFLTDWDLSYPTFSSPYRRAIP
jgi:hypothetical protein